MNQLSLLDSTPSGDAIFSPCRQYRYILWRRWSDDWPSNYVMFIGLNPSTADETTDDPTIRRCINYAKSWGYSGLCMANLFAYRATQPKLMMAADDPIGPDNDRYLAEYGKAAKAVIAAWGNHGTFLSRHLHVKQLFPELLCLQVTKTGQPNHPLYLLSTVTPIPYV